MSDRHADIGKLLIWASILLTAIGILEIYAASSSRAMEQFDDPYLFLRKHVITFFISMILVILFQSMPLRYFTKAPLALLFLAITSLSLLFIPELTITVGIAGRWVQVLGFSFQPAELAKLALVFFLAKNLSRPVCDLSKVWYVLQNLLPLLVLCSLIMWQPDFGTTILLVSTCFAMLLVAGLRPRDIAVFACGLLVFASVAIYVAPYRFQRLLTFLDPWSQRADGGFQIIQSYLAFQNGGILGAGLGESKQKLFFLPEAHTDFILSVIGEELGLLGVFFIWAVFFYICYAGFHIATQVRDQYHKFLAFGLTTLITSQALLNMGVATGLLPTKGLPLPFVSSGSSSLLVFFITIGILARLGKEIPDPKLFGIG